MSEARGSGLEETVVRGARYVIVRDCEHVLVVEQQRRFCERVQCRRD